MRETSWRMVEVARLPMRAAELAVGTTIVVVHLMLASRIDRPRRTMLGPPGRPTKTTPVWMQE